MDFIQLAQVTVETSTSGNPITAVIGLIFVLLTFASWWLVFAKAGEPGCLAFIPIVNVITILRIAGKPWWWIFGFFIPILNFILAIVVLIDFAKAFGKGTLFALGLVFFNFIFMLILAFDNSEYQGAPA